MFDSAASEHRMVFYAVHMLLLGLVKIEIEERLYGGNLYGMHGIVDP